MTEWREEIAAILQERICTTSAAVAIAVIDGGQVSVVSHPTPEVRSLRFAIDSNSKTVLGTTLAHHVLAGRADLDDRISRWVAVGENGSITLRELVRHTSGLPRLSDALATHPGFDPHDPYAHYTEDLLLQDVADATLGPKEPAYSNLGFQLLGLLVSRIGEAPLADQFRTVVFEPLGMRDTVLYARGLDRLAPGSARGLPVRRWTAAVPGAGEVESTIDDMVTYVRAAIAPPADGIGRALRLAIGTDTDDALAWNHYTRSVIGHDGASAGFMSVMLAQPSSGRGVVVLAGAGDNPFGALALRALVGADIPPPPVQLSPDHAALVGFVRALRDNDTEAALPHLDGVFLDDPETMVETASEFEELAPRISSTDIKVLPGQPPAALLTLNEGEVLQILVNPASEKIHGFFVCPEAGPYAG